MGVQLCDSAPWIVRHGFGWEVLPGHGALPLPLAWPCQDQQCPHGYRARTSSRGGRVSSLSSHPAPCQMGSQAASLLRDSLMHHDHPPRAFPPFFHHCCPLLLCCRVPCRAAPCCLAALLPSASLGLACSLGSSSSRRCTTLSGGTACRHVLEACGLCMSMCPMWAHVSLSAGRRGVALACSGPWACQRLAFGECGVAGGWIARVAPQNWCIQ